MRRPSENPLKGVCRGRFLRSHALRVSWPDPRHKRHLLGGMFESDFDGPVDEAAIIRNKIVKIASPSLFHSRDNRPRGKSCACVIRGQHLHHQVLWGVHRPTSRPLRLHGLHQTAVPPFRHHPVAGEFRSLAAPPPYFRPLSGRRHLIINVIFFFFFFFFFFVLYCIGLYCTVYCVYSIGIRGQFSGKYKLNTWPTL